MSDSQQCLIDFYARVNCNNEESVEDCLRRQIQEDEKRYKNLENKCRSQALANQALQNRVKELLEEKKEDRKLIEYLQQKLAVYDSLKNSFVGIDNVVDVKIKAEKREYKKAKRAYLEDENHHDDEIQYIPSQPSSYIYRDDNRRKRKAIEDHFGNLSLEDRSSSSSFHGNREPPQ
jgi:alanyl-tRNA synthetase